MLTQKKEQDSMSPCIEFDFAMRIAPVDGAAGKDSEPHDEGSILGVRGASS